MNILINIRNENHLVFLLVEPSVWWFLCIRESSNIRSFNVSTTFPDAMIRALGSNDENGILKSLGIKGKGTLFLFFRRTFHPRLNHEKKSTTRSRKKRLDRNRGGVSFTFGVLRNSLHVEVSNICFTIIYAQHTYGIGNACSFCVYV